MNIDTICHSLNEIVNAGIISNQFINNLHILILNIKATLNFKNTLNPAVITAKAIFV